MTDSDDDVPVDDIDIQDIIAQYLKAYATNDDRECLLLRERWKACYGLDSLHETAIGRGK